MNKQEFCAFGATCGLKMIFEKSGRIIELSGLQITDGDSLVYICYDQYYSSAYFNFKPIVRPLSDLTKECVQADYNDGKPFIPIVELAKMVYPYKWNLDGCQAKSEHFDLFSFDSEYNVFTMEDGYDGSFEPLNQLRLFQQLLKWHFWPDMPEGEEVAYVNESFNPYK